MKHIKRAIIIIATLTALTIAGMAQDYPKLYMTGQLTNGRGWAELSHEGKVGYLMGYSDHWYATAVVHTDEQDAVPSHITMSELAKAVDKLYAEPLNTLLTVRMVLSIVAATVNGYSADVIQRMTEADRKLAREIADKDK